MEKEDARIQDMFGSGASNERIVLQSDAAICHGRGDGINGEVASA